MFIMNLLVYLLIIYKHLKDTELAILVLVLALLMFLCGAGSLYFFIICSSDNPESPLVITQHQLKEQGCVFEDFHKYEYYCNICEAVVEEKTKHCKRCNKCVHGFDHHCGWLNNCIGSSNYRPFFNLICVTELALFIAISIASIAINSDNVRADQTDLVIICMALVLNVGATGGVTTLLAFHIYLKFVGMTSIEYMRLKE